MSATPKQYNQEVIRKASSSLFFGKNKSSAPTTGSPSPSNSPLDASRTDTPKDENKSTKKLIRLNLSRPKSDRYEWLNFLYDPTYSPFYCWEIESRWMVGEGVGVCEFISGLTRKARSCNFLLIQVPNSLDMNHPLRSSLFNTYPKTFRDTVSSLPWPIVAGAIEQALCANFNFFRYREPNSYIHKTGSIFLKVTKEGFQWTVNWLMSHYQNQRVVKEFTNFMHSLSSFESLLSDYLETAEVTPPLTKIPEPKASINSNNSNS